MRLDGVPYNKVAMNIPGTMAYKLKAQHQE